MNLCTIRKMVSGICYLVKILSYFLFPLFIFTFIFAIAIVTYSEVIFVSAMVAPIIISIFFYQEIKRPKYYYFHPEEEPTFINDHSCIKVIRCKYCGIELNRSEIHNWGEWHYEKDNSCHQIRRCDRCKKIESRGPVHDFGEWHYEKDNSCNQIRRCDRCEKIESRGPVHNWGEWHYEKDNSSDKIRRCDRCEKIESRRPVHDWGGSGTSIDRETFEDRSINLSGQFSSLTQEEKEYDIVYN